MDTVIEKNRKKVVLPLIIALFAYFMSSLLRLSAVVAMPILQEQLNLSASVVGAVSSSFYVTYAFMQLIGGAMCLRFGTLSVLCFEFTVAGLGSLLFGTAASPAQILVGRILLGLGVGPILVVVLSILQENFSGKEYSKWMGFAFVASNSGAVFSSAPLQMAINKFGIKNLFVFFAELLILCAVITVVCIRINGKQKITKDVGVLKQIQDAGKIVLGSKVICGCFLIWILINPLLAIYQSLWCVKWTSCAFSVNPGLHAYSGTLIGIGIIIGCLIGDNVRNQNAPRLNYIKRLSISEVIGFFLLIVVKNISDSLPILIVSLTFDAVYGYILGAVCIQIGSYIRENSDATHNAMIMGIMNCINNLTSSGFQSLSGVLIDAFAVTQVMKKAFTSTFLCYEVVNIVFIALGLLIISNNKEKK